MCLRERAVGLGSHRGPRLCRRGRRG